jgi:allophanate hydrolase
MPRSPPSAACFTPTPACRSARSAWRSRRFPPCPPELKSFGARYLERTTTAASYRLFALSDCVPPKPGLIRVGAAEGAAIEIEIWALPAEKFGRFVAAVPPPLAIGTLEVADGRKVKGFLVEAEATRGARDISAFGGWRAFLEQLKLPA